jgi:hypothetical protein
MHICCQGRQYVIESSHMNGMARGLWSPSCQSNEASASSFISKKLRRFAAPVYGRTTNEQMG